MNLHEEIADIAKQYLKGVKKVGSNNIAAICPFHTKADGTPERSPSFSMSVITGAWHCFACHEVGNLRTFLRSVGISHYLIEHQYGVVLEEASRSVPKRLDPLQPNLILENPLPESLLGLFQYCPKDLLDEGFNEGVLEYFDVGFDKQHMRITYPLRDISGQLFGISGRTVTDAIPRYKVYDKEYSAWDLPTRMDGDNKKRTILWNADRVYPAVMDVQDAKVVIVEGFKACMWLAQCGISNVVALLGSYLSEEQHWIFETIGARLYLMTDNDEAGTKARRTIGQKLARSLDVRVVLYGDAEKKWQPDYLDSDEVYKALDEAPDFYRWMGQDRDLRREKERGSVK